MRTAIDPLPDLLTRLSLKAMRDRLDEAARRDLSLRETLALLCEAEVAHREQRRIQMSLGIAEFPFERSTASTSTHNRRSIPARFATWRSVAG